jgi:hypothetical protein
MLEMSRKALALAAARSADEDVVWRTVRDDLPVLVASLERKAGSSG